jgi:FkbM family methyltransferase
MSLVESEIVGKPSSFLHVGAGEGELLRLARRAETSILVEPNPERFRALAVAAGTDSNIKVCHVGVGEAAGKATFRKVSLTRFGSTRRAAGLRQVFPGLRDAGEVQVDVLPLADILGGSGLKAPAVIVIDCASEALVILRQIESLGLLDGNSQVFVKVSEIELHEGGATHDSVAEWLEERSWSLRRLDGQNDPSVWLAQIVPLDVEAEQEPQPASTSEIEALHEELAKAQQEVSELQERLERTGKTSDRNRSRASRAEKRNEALKSENDSLNRRLALMEKRTSSAEAQASRLSELEAKAAQLETVAAEARSIQSQLQKLESDHASLREEHQVLNQTHKELRRQVEVKNAGLEASAAERGKLIESLDTQRAEMDSCRADLSLALRIQRLAQADLQDLQQRYGELEQEKSSLEALLIKLMDRLYEASGEFDAVSWKESDADTTEESASGSSRG